MSLSRLRKAPGRWLERMSTWRRTRSKPGDDGNSGKIGGPCCEVSGNAGERRSRTRTRVGRRNTQDEELSFDEISGAHSTTGTKEEPLISDKDKTDFMNLANENISMDFILEMREAFQLFDKNGDGFISAKELGVLMRTLGRNPTEEEILNIMNEIDVDHNGKLDFSEFTIMMREKLTGEDMEQEIKQAFRVFDRNGDGFISKAEFKHCMMHFGERFTDEEVEEMIAEADSNRDGKIDYTEFSQMILNEIDTDPRTKAHQQASPAPRAPSTSLLANGGIGSTSTTPLRSRRNA